MPAATPEQLDALGRYALRLVRAGQVLGLGTGHAASAFIRALGASGTSVRGVATSNASADLGRDVGIEVIELGAARAIDTDFDGADEVDARLNMIKGYGGALVREKIVAVSSKKFVVLVGEEKIVPKLGHRGSLPVEVVPFAEPLARKKLAALGLKPKIREQHGKPIITDNGNIIFDCGLRPISNAAKLDRELHAIPGVVGTGLFLELATTVLVACADGSIRTMRPRR